MVLRKLSQSLKFFLAVMVTIFSSGLMPSSVAYASSHNNGGGQDNHVEVTICHATDSHSNPYTVNTVDDSSIDEENNQYLNGHGDHIGDVWYEGIADHSWGDIIPPFTNSAGSSFLGQNWTTDGQAIWNNGCEVPTVNEKVTVTAPYATDPTCEADGALVIPTTAHVTWTGGADGNGPDTYNLVAIADTGYEIDGQSEWTVEVLPQLTGEACEELTLVTPEVPTPNDICGTENDSVTLPTTEGVTYHQVTNGNGSITVTATADEGYAFTAGSEIEWTFHFTDKQCKVTICHRTNSVTNPYVKISVAASAVDGDTGNDNGQGDHLAEHTGPVFNPDTEYPTPHNGDQWGDIIPTIEGVTPGLNWTTEGQEIYNNNCNVPEDEEEPQADIDFTVACVANGVKVTLTNSGDAAGSATVNGDVVNVPANDSVDVTLDFDLGTPFMTEVTVTIDGVTSTQTVNCTPGQGGQTQGTSTTTTPQTLGTSTLPATLPATGGESNPLMIVLASLLAYGAAYFLQGRRMIGRKEALEA